MNMPRATIAVALALAASCEPPPADDVDLVEGDVTSGTIYTLKAANSGMCVDVTGGSTANGVKIEQWTCLANHKNQQWVVTAKGSGQYEFRSANSPSGTPLCLDVTGSSTLSGAVIQQWGCNNQPNQRWTLKSLGNNQYNVVAVNSAKCLDVYQASTAAGGVIDQWSCNAHTSQTFTFTAVGSGGVGGSGGTGGSGGSGGTGGSPPPPSPAPAAGPGNFPARFAAPYVPTWNDTNLVNLSNSTGNKFWTLAFVINGGSCNPLWNGDTSLGGTSYGSYISNLRKIGGDVIVSFGGQAGTEIAVSCGDVASTQAAYQKVINQFGLTWIDLDIESGQESQSASVDRRNKAMHNLQAANPGLRISYTLAVDRGGLPSADVNLLKNAKANGVNVTDVNIMAMDYGPCYSDMGQAAVDAANATRNQLSGIGLSAHVGVTPMIGRNDVSCENFSTTDANVLVKYAQANSFINLLAYWEQGTDGSHGYINVFKTFH